MKSTKTLVRIERKGRNDSGEELDPVELILGRIREGKACSLCGNDEGYDEDYYSQLEWVLKDRFFACLMSNMGSCYKDGILDCIHAVFGPKNPEIREMLKECGFLSRFDQLVDPGKVGLSQFGRFASRFL